MATVPDKSGNNRFIDPTISSTGDELEEINTTLSTINTSIGATNTALSTVNTSIGVVNTSVNSVYPIGATPLTATSGNVANSAAVATLAGVSGKTTYVSNINLSGGGATLGSIVLASLAGIISGTQTYAYGVVAGVLLSNNSLNISFNPPIPASAVNTAIVLTLPALGAGNTNATANITGYQL